MSDFSRLFTIYVLQVILVIIHGFLLYKIIKRKKKTKTSISLSFFFTFIIIAFILNLIYVPIQINPIVFILYIIVVFLLLFAAFFLVLTLLNLHLEINFKVKFVIGLFYLTIVILILFIPNGIRYDQGTNWNPKYNWEVFIAIYLYFVVMILIPSIIILLKIIKKIYETKLKKRLWSYFIGEIILTTGSFGLALYNTWENQTFRFVWPFILFLLITLNGLLVYYGLGKEFSLKNNRKGT
ncbi:MAG: hypothetical protein ACFFHD_06620 [Promethearchaeota archaeon]